MYHPHASVRPVEFDWTFVSFKHPCTICGSNDGCRRGEEEFACCVRIGSQWPLTAGGWVHRVERPPVEAEIG